MRGLTRAASCRAWADDIARKGGHRIWSEVLVGAEFQQLSVEDKAAAKEQYWNDVLRPNIEAGRQMDSYRWFMFQN